MDLFLLLLLYTSCCGITFTIVHAEIMDMIKLRPLWNKWQFTNKLFKCSFCTGFYIGVILTLTFFPFGLLWIITPFSFAFVTFFLDRIVILLDDLISKINKK